MNNYDVVKKLIGPIDPVGEHYTDEQRLKNLKAMIDLVDDAVYDLSDVALNALRREASMKDAGVMARDFLQQLSEYYNPDDR